jgi:hypothetical protein
MIHDKRFKQLQKIYENMEEEKMYHGTSNQFDKPSFDKIFWMNYPIR